MTRSRQRGRRPQQNNHSGGGNSSQHHNPNRTFDSNGPEIKIRGSASHVYDKYLQLARDANAQGDRVAAENYLQHAEHYYRILAAAQAQQQQYQQPRQQPYNGNGRVNGDGAQPATSEPSFSLAEGMSEAEADQADAAE
ncbi:MAG TPA: DUF4167 domain-containing protein [Rhizomicrobium sp.]